MKENPKMPNLDSIVAGFAANPPSVQAPSPKRVPAEIMEYETTDIADMETTTGIWDSFLKELGRPKKTQEAGQKIYKIDSDLIATLSQCELNASITHVVNAIIRTFILSNLTRLEKLRTHSLFDRNDRNINPQQPML